MKKKILYFLIIITMCIGFYGCSKEEKNVKKDDIKKYIMNDIEELGIKDSIDKDNIKIKESEKNKFEIHIPYNLKNSVAMFNEDYNQNIEITVEALKGIAVLTESIPILMKDEGYKDFNITAYIDILDTDLDDKNKHLYTLDSNGTIFLAKDNSIIIYKDGNIIGNIVENEIEKENKLEKEDVEEFINGYLSYLLLKSGGEIEGNTEVEEININEFEVHMRLELENTFSVFNLRENFPSKWKEHIKDMRDNIRSMENTIESHFKEDGYNIKINIIMDLIDPTLESLVIYSVDNEGNVYENDEIIEHY